MAVAVEQRDLSKIARSYGRTGKPAPDWVTSDPALSAAYDEAAGKAPGTPAPSPPKSRPRKTTPGPAPTPAPKPSTRGGQSPVPARTRTTRPASRGGAGRSFPSITGSHGDGGGLMLAVFIYPLVLAVLQKGPAGVTAWLKAKFLNNGTSARAGDQTNHVGTQQDPNAHLPKLPAPHGTGRLPNGQKIPGTPPDLNPGQVNT